MIDCRPSALEVFGIRFESGRGPETARLGKAQLPVTHMFNPVVPGQFQLNFEAVNHVVKSVADIEQFAKLLQSNNGRSTINQ
jgi:hypothetical protein